jgi:hypothetical protein
LGHHHLSQPVLGLLAGNNGLIALLLGLLPMVPLDRQFVLHSLENLFCRPLLSAQTLSRLLLGDPFVCQLGLEVVHRHLGFLEEMFRVLACGDLLSQRLTRCVELVGAGTVFLIPVDHQNRAFAIPDEAPTLWMGCARRGWWRNGSVLRWGRIMEAEGAAHLRLGCTEACVI